MRSTTQKHYLKGVNLFVDRGPALGFDRGSIPVRLPPPEEESTPNSAVKAASLVSENTFDNALDATKVGPLTANFPTTSSQTTISIDQSGSSDIVTTSHAGEDNVEVSSSASLMKVYCDDGRSFEVEFDPNTDSALDVAQICAHRITCPGGREIIVTEQDLADSGKSLICAHRITCPDGREIIVTEQDLADSGKSLSQFCEEVLEVDPEEVDIVVSAQKVDIPRNKPGTPAWWITTIAYSALGLLLWNKLRK